ncbi:MAG: hypothetical protein HFI38_07405 [Lachnospiraceae bacterium]|jgi:hypothetical protein|nr:hypothetical protein [Lachnospiraceae bacterium]
MKRILLSLIAVILFLTLGGCQLPERPVELSDEEVVVALIEAFKQGDYEGLKPYISDDNPLHLLFSGMAEETGGDLAPAYRAIHEKVAGSVTYTAEAVEGKEAWGTVSVTLSAASLDTEIYNAMTQALSEQARDGGSAFHDMPDWLLKAAQGEAVIQEEIFELHVGCRDGNMVMDTNTNRRFFAMLCGGLKPYLKASITTCTFPTGVTWQLLAQGDEIIAMLHSEIVDGAAAGYTSDDLDATAQLFVDTYAALDGVCAFASVADNVLHASFGIDMETASTYALHNMGLISDRLTAGSNGWLSLDDTLSNFTRSGGSYETETFRPE